MRRFLFAIDHLSTWVGKAFAWVIVPLTLLTTIEAGQRYLFSSPTDWAFDASYILYGTLFMMGGAYTLARNGHVRGDMFYRLWPVKVQATVDLVLYFLFFFPGISALVWAGWQFANFSRLLNERSPFSPGGPIIWPYKFIIPLAGLFLFIQGIAEVIRCIQAIRSGEWPERLSDVEELEETLLAKGSGL